MDDARSRTRYWLLVTALTGAATVGSLTATGLTTGALAQSARDDATTSGQTGTADGVTAPAGSTATGTVQWQERPRRTVVRRHHVVRVDASLPAGAAPPTADTILGGGTVSSAAPAGPSAGPGPATSGPAPAGGPGGGGSGTTGPGSTGPSAGAPSTPSTPSTPPTSVEPPPPVPPAPEPSVPSTGS